MESQEIWKDIPDTNGLYSASNMGRFKRTGVSIIDSIGRVQCHREKILKKSYYSNGYERVRICVNGCGKDLLAHRILAILFIPNPDDKSEVNHINGTKADNRLDNLEWVTPKENSKHSLQNGLAISGSRSHFSKLTEVDVIEIRRLLSLNITGRKIAKMFSVSPSLISNINTNKKWQFIQI